MTDLTRRIDPASFPILGLLGAVACGPLGPSQGETGGGTDGSTSDPTSGTDSTDSTDSTSPTTTMPPIPECRVDADCDDVACGYCTPEGECVEEVGCCGEYGVEQMDDGKWRCSPPYYGCDYGNEVCPDGYVCQFNECVPLAQPIPLPSCRPPDLEVRAWNFSEPAGALALADLDTDGDLDIVLAHSQVGAIELGINDGAAGFTPGGTVDVGVAGALALATGDLDGDGDPDVAVASSDGAGMLWLAFNDGAMFTVGDPIAVVGAASQLFIADVDGDAALDVVTIRSLKPSVGVQRGDGMGGLASEQALVPDKLSSGASVVDFGGDAAADLLAPLAGEPTIRAWLGGPGAPAPVADFVSTQPGGRALVNHTGLPGNSDVVVVQPLETGGLIEAWVAVEFPLYAGPVAFTTGAQLFGGALAELDGQPGIDLVAATADDNVALIFGGGQSGFACEHLHPISGDSAPEMLAVGDVDGDGRNDIVAAGVGSTSVELVLLK